MFGQTVLRNEQRCSSLLPVPAFGPCSAIFEIHEIDRAGKLDADVGGGGGRRGVSPPTHLGNINVSFSLSEIHARRSRAFAASSAVMRAVDVSTSNHELCEASDSKGSRRFPRCCRNRAGYSKLHVIHGVSGRPVTPLRFAVGRPLAVHVSRAFDEKVQATRPANASSLIRFTFHSQRVLSFIQRALFESKHNVATSGG